MRLSSATVVMLLLGAGLAMATTTTRTPPLGFGNGEHLNRPDGSPASVTCPGASYLVGMAAYVEDPRLRVSDLLSGISPYCVAMADDGSWKGAAQVHLLPMLVAVGDGGLRKDFVCPRDYYLVNFSGSTQTYGINEVIQLAIGCMKLRTHERITLQTPLNGGVAATPWPAEQCADGSVATGAFGLVSEGVSLYQFGLICTPTPGALAAQRAHNQLSTSPGAVVVTPRPVFNLATPADPGPGGSAVSSVVAPEGMSAIRAGPRGGAAPTPPIVGAAATPAMPKGATATSWLAPNPQHLTAQQTSWQALNPQPLPPGPPDPNRSDSSNTANQRGIIIVGGRSVAQGASDGSAAGLRTRAPAGIAAGKHVTFEVVARSKHVKLVPDHLRILSVALDARAGQNAAALRARTHQGGQPGAGASGPATGGARGAWSSSPAALWSGVNNPAGATNTFTPPSTQPAPSALNSNAASDPTAARSRTLSSQPLTAGSSGPSGSIGLNRSNISNAVNFATSNLGGDPATPPPSIGAVALSGRVPATASLANAPAPTSPDLNRAVGAPGRALDAASVAQGPPSRYLTADAQAGYERRPLGVWFVNGESSYFPMTPGGYLTIAGKGFGERLGRVTMLGDPNVRARAPSEVRLLVTDWNDDEIYAQLPEGIRGMPDQDVRLQVMTHAGTVYLIDKGKFRAAREEMTVTTNLDRIIEVHSTSNWKPTIGGDGQIVRYEDNLWNGDDLTCRAPGSDQLYFNPPAGYDVSGMTVWFGRTDAGDGDLYGHAGDRVFTPGYSVGDWTRASLAVTRQHSKEVWMIPVSWGVWRSHTSYAGLGAQFRAAGEPDDLCESNYQVALTLTGPAGVAPF